MFEFVQGVIKNDTLSMKVLIYERGWNGFCTPALRLNEERPNRQSNAVVACRQGRVYKLFTHSAPASQIDFSQDHTHSDSLVTVFFRKGQTVFRTGDVYGECNEDRHHRRRQEV